MMTPKKILIVEDNTLNMKLFSDILLAHGFMTIQSSTGLDALSLAYDEKPDVIIMDIQLPELNGTDLIRNIRQDSNLKHIPIIAVTAFAMQGDEERILEAGCNMYLSKPISIGQFLEAVTSFTHQAA